jgi:hypothetical protein
MNLEEIMLDLIQRITRVEEKVDTLIEKRRSDYSVKVQVVLAMVGSATAIGIAVFL